MTKEDRKMLTEAMGECFHEWIVESYNYPKAYCGRCKCDLTECFGDGNRTFDNPTDFFDLWNWAKGQEWWPKFVAQNGDYQMDEPAAGLRECGWIDTELIDPVKFPELIANYLEEQRHDSHRSQR